MSFFKHPYRINNDKSLNFNNNLSLYDNFNKLCSLPFYKPRSDATKKLASVLKFCTCHSFRNNIFLSITDSVERRKKLLQELINLELAKRAIDLWEEWHTIHRKKSERKDKINYFKSNIEAKQKELIHSDNSYFQNHRKPNEHVWNNPLPYLHDNDFFFMTLNAEQKAAYDSLDNSLNIKHGVKNFRPKPFSCFAICASLLNYSFFDWDFNFILDFTTSYFI